MYGLLKPLLFKLDPETLHDLVLKIGKRAGRIKWVKNALRSVYDFEHEALRINVFGKEFRNPLGLAAGFDKNGELIDLLPCLGFGFAEIGSVTAKPCEGNPRPRIFRLVEDEALINRMGLNNYGADVVAEKLSGRRFEIPLGINIAKTHDPTIMGERAIEDFLYSFERLYPLGDFTVLNISCPNTREGKTFEDKEALDELLEGLSEPRKRFGKKKPVLVKISPDLSYEALDGILEVCKEHGIDGYVISNTTTERCNLKTDEEKVRKIGYGGLSGRPLKNRATELIKYVYSQRDDETIIGVGGIFSAEDAYEKITAGSSLVEVFTGLIYRGPGVVREINKNLVRMLEREGFSNVEEAVGYRSEKK